MSWDSWTYFLWRMGGLRWSLIFVQTKKAKISGLCPKSISTSQPVAPNLSGHASVNRPDPKNKQTNLFTYYMTSEASWDLKDTNFDMFKQHSVIKSCYKCTIPSPFFPSFRNHPSLFYLDKQSVQWRKRNRVHCKAAIQLCLRKASSSYRSFSTCMYLTALIQ